MELANKKKDPGKKRKYIKVHVLLLTEQFLSLFVLNKKTNGVSVCGILCRIGGKKLP
jgi:hypothetical protein